MELSEMTYEKILRVAMEQSAADLNCRPEDFVSGENVTVISQPSASARKYLELPFFCQLVSYGDNVVASVSAEFAPFVREYINRHGAVRSFETPSLHELESALRGFGHRVCFMAEYFLPVPELPVSVGCGLKLRVMGKSEFERYYLPAFGNALCADHPERDVIAVGAFDGDRLAGLAGASADCETMWQIGVDVLPEYRRRGIASAMTSRLALEIFNLGKVPFYCAAWSNVRSVRNALRSGFRPAWVELTAKSEEFIHNLK